MLHAIISAYTDFDNPGLSKFRVNDKYCTVEWVKWPCQAAEVVSQLASLVWTPEMCATVQIRTFVEATIWI